MEEQNKTQIYSYDAEAAWRLLKTREASDNSTEIFEWIGKSIEIVKSYHDGYISDKDIDERENFIGYSYTRESMLITCLGLLEKSSDPKAKAQIGQLRRHLSILRLCRGNLMKNTPPKNIAKSIQAKQEAQKEENKKSASHNLQTSGLKSPADLFDSNLLSTSNKSNFNSTNPLMAAIILSQMKHVGWSKGELQAALRAQKLSGTTFQNDKDYKMFAMAASASSFMQNLGFSQNDLAYLSTLDLQDQNDILKMKQLFTEHELRDTDYSLLNDTKSVSFIDNLKNAIYKQDLAYSSSYDNSLADPILQDRISNKSKEELIAHKKALLARRTYQLSERNEKNQSFSVDNYYKRSNDLHRR